MKVFIFFFSGHGFSIGGEYYIAPTEMEMSDIKNTGIKFDDILDILNELKKRIPVMVFLILPDTNERERLLNIITTLFHFY